MIYFICCYLRSSELTVLVSYVSSTATMSTSTQIASSPTSSPNTSSLCGYCLQKPRRNGYTYCSKTCGSLAQARTGTNANSDICNYCHKKPKFSSFAYCGKTCANAAKTQGLRSTTPGPMLKVSGNSKPKRSKSPGRSVEPSNTAGQVLCKVSGCQKPVHIDPSGHYEASEYCSIRHLLQAVQSGLVSPCIMCLTMPRSKQDYFCGKKCREEALKK